MRHIQIITTVLLVVSIFFISNNEAKASKKMQVNSISEFTSKVEKNVENYTGKFEIVYTGNMTNFQKNARNILPAIMKENDQVAGTLKSYKQTLKYSSTKGAVVYELSYFTSKKKDDIANKMIAAEVKKIKKTAKTDFQKVKAVNDFVVKNTSYGGKKADRYTTYGLMKDKVAVCQGYALVTLNMLEALNVQVRYVVGTARNQNHAWNKVRVAGSWYNLDVTWNDPTPNSPTEVQYNHFLLSDKQLAKTHKWNKTDYPAGKSTKYDALANASSAVLVGNKFFYSNKKDKEKLYSFDIKTNKTKKVSNTRVQYLVYGKGKLYFSNYSNGAYIYSMKTSGKSLKRHNKKNSKNLKISGSYLHYQIGNKKYKLKIK